jgi:3-deoxy-D-manno-octulosonic-acid transferase
MDKHFAYLIYFLFSLKAGVLAWPYFWWHLKRRGQGESFFPRLGLRLPAGELPAGSPRLWIHGVSVGEVMSALPLVEELKKLLPRAAFLITTGTETGQALAHRQFAPHGAYVCYFPLDIPWAVHRYLDHLRPDVFIALESELWPNFLLSARRRGVRLALLNARLSEKSFARFSLFKGYVVELFNLFEVIAAGSPQDYARLCALGLSEDQVVMAGNLKIDRLLGLRTKAVSSTLLSTAPRTARGENSATEALSASMPGDLREALNLEGQPVFLAASTHPGEDEAVIEAFEQLLGPYPSLVLLLAPRHPQRAAEVGRLLRQRGLAFQLWHRLKAGQETRTQPVVVVDTIGDLLGLYGVADVAFVGGSLVPHGGQNLLEPAAWGVAPLYGPHVGNFLWAKDILDAARAGITVHDALTMAVAVRNLLDHPDLRREMGARALAALAPHQGAAARQARLIVKMLCGGPTGA